MTIPNVCMNWCHRKATCKWCGFIIETAHPMVTVFFWNKGTDTHKGFNVKQYYHPKCWIEQGLDYLKKNPYIPYVRHVPSKLTPEQLKTRISLLRRKAALEQRRRNIKSEYPDRILVEARLEKHIAELMVEIIKVGGIPKKWLENLT